MLSKQLIQAASGSAAAGAGLGVEDVFSTFLYAGNNTTQTITNGIDLAGEGGLVWVKSRNNTFVHDLADTVRGPGYRLNTNNAAVEAGPNVSDTVGFTSTGFNLAVNTGAGNSLGTNYAAWTFRKAPGFFDVVAYTGDGVAGRTVAHNLGSVPGCMIIKCTSHAQEWFVHHRSLGALGGLKLNGIDAVQNETAWLNSTLPTSSVFTVGTSGRVNDLGKTYVAYLFAHDEQIFGEGGNQSVIKCGSFTCDGSGNIGTVNLGWEPQYILAKRSNGLASWYVFDTMRGMALNSTLSLNPNLPDAELDWTTSSGFIYPTATGFAGTGNFFGPNAQVVYIAIRRGPMKTPTDATEVFNAVSFTGDGSTTRIIESGFADDLFMIRAPQVNGVNTSVIDRIRGKTLELRTNATNSETDASPNYWAGFDTQSGVEVFNINAFNASGRSQITYHFRRAPGFFDVVAYTGVGGSYSFSHNLGVAPELMIIKDRTTGYNWVTYSASIPITDYLYLNSNAGKNTSNFWENTPPSATQFTVSSALQVNKSGDSYIAYLFASCPGVSKVGSYTGNYNTDINVDCGFAGSARFVMIKRTDTTGDWYVFDTARGIYPTLNDPYLLLNSTAQEVTSQDVVKPFIGGFTAKANGISGINDTGGNYIYLAIA